MKKAVGIIITVSMIMSSCMVAFGATTNSVYKTDENGNTAFSTQDEGDSKDVHGSYLLTGADDADGDGVPDTDTKLPNGDYGTDTDADGIPDGDGVPDTEPDYDINGDDKPDNLPEDLPNFDWDGDGDVDQDDASVKPSDSPNIDAPSAITPDGATYSVDIVWGDMKFDYKVENATWDPEQHKYVGGTQAWYGRYDGDKVANGENDLSSEEIKVTNNSNVAVRVRYAFTSTLEDADGTPVNLKGTFTDPLMKLQHSVGKLPASDIATLALSGDPGTAALSDAKLGAITIKIDYTIVP